MVWSVAGPTRGEGEGRDRAGVDPAVHRARRVVGLYGDPDVTWSVVLALRLSTTLTAEVVSAAAEVLVRDHPHLGAVPPVEVYAPDDESAMLAAYANRPYCNGDPLLRVALSADGRGLLVAAHHGAVDGLGLLGVATALVGTPLMSNARGIARESEPTRFVRGSLRRLVEAAFTPPMRVAGDRTPKEGETGDWLEARDVDVPRPGSAALVRTAVDLVRRGNAGHRRRGRLVVSMGLSRRPGTPVPTPDRDTAYMRMRADAVASTDEARRLVARTAPEPAFPVRDAGGLGPRVARLLSPRLGATVLVSNLGLVDSAVVERIRFWPVPSGPAGVCLGLASTPATTTLTLRARRGWFSASSACALADLAAECLQRAGQ
jgi:hypothetical protein